MRLLFNPDTWQEIFDSISKNKVRTAITVIGVLWGIFIYVVLSGAAKGMDNGFEKEFRGMAVNSMFIWTQNTSVPYAGYKIGRRFSLKMGDVEILKSRIPEIQYIAPRNNTGNWGSAPAQTVYGSKSGAYTTYGDFPVLAKIDSKKIFDGGRFINQNDIDNDSKVCVIGERTRDELFEKDEDPIGKFIRMDGIYFQVVGVHKTSQGGGMASDSDIYIPFSTFSKIYNRGDRVGWFAIAAYPDADITQAEKDVKRVLKELHKVSPEDERAIGCFNLGEEFDRIMGFTKGMTFLSLIVGVGTILAGVIGIGNILLISVKERTKELGIRRALGATPSEIRGQILLESVFLTLMSGTVGIILGSFVLFMINAATENLDGFPYHNPTVPVTWILAALALMVVLGTVIGLIPAQRAVSIKPIDALREE